jgi:hypothetical protein
MSNLPSYDDPPRVIRIHETRFEPADWDRKATDEFPEVTIIDDPELVSLHYRHYLRLRRKWRSEHGRCLPVYLRYFTNPGAVLVRYSTGPIRLAGRNP